jgi:hypothetical protein
VHEVPQNHTYRECATYGVLPCNAILRMCFCPQGSQMRRPCLNVCAVNLRLVHRISLCTTLLLQACLVLAGQLLRNCSLLDDAHPQLICISLRPQSGQCLRQRASAPVTVAATATATAAVCVRGAALALRFFHFIALGHTAARRTLHTAARRTLKAALQSNALASCDFAKP